MKSLRLLVAAAVLLLALPAFADMVPRTVFAELGSATW